MSSRDFKLFEGKNELSIIILHQRKAVYMFGCGLVTCIAGELRVDHHELKACSYEDGKGIHVAAPAQLKRPVEFYAPESSDALGTSYKYKRIEYRLKEIISDYSIVMCEIQTGDRCPCVFVIQPHVRSDLRIIEKREPRFIIEQLAEDDEARVKKHGLLEMDSYSSRKRDEFCALEKIGEVVHKNCAANLRSVIVPWGGKDAGKSTFTRYLFNYFLSATNSSPTPLLYLLEADPGQTEFLPAGTMSLRLITEPILDPAFCHQTTDTGITAYFLGGVDVSSWLVKYMEIFERLYNEFTAQAPPNAILIINTMGWITGDGADMLRHIFTISEPLISIYMDGGRVNAEEGETRIFKPQQLPVPPLMRQEIKLARFFLRPPPNQSHAPHNRGLSPATMRDFAMLGYLRPLFKRADMASFFDLPPYQVNFRHITIVQKEDCGYQRDNQWLAAINNKLVAICHIDKRDHRKLKAEHRMMQNMAYPMLAIAANDSNVPLLRFIGFALVRGVDLETNQLYLHTPLDLEALNEPPLLVRGDKVELPDWFFTSQIQEVDKAPYFIESNAMCDGRNDHQVTELYGAFNFNAKTNWERMTAKPNRNGKGGGT